AVVIGAGLPLPVPGRGDRTYRFYAHSEYLYLTDRERPGAVLAFDAAEGWFDFVPHPTAKELLWSGAPAAEPGISTEELPGWLEAAFLRNGGDAVAYETIVAGGPNSAVLHFVPTSRVFADGDLVLIDAGAEVRGYACDVTRTYPASGSFTPEQQALHALVAASLTAAIEQCVPGNEWLAVHADAASVIAEGLVDFGLLRGPPDALVESGAVT